MSQAAAGNNGTANASTQTKITGEHPKTSLEEAVMDYLRERRIQMIRERNRELSRLTANFRRHHTGAHHSPFDSY